MPLSDRRHREGGRRGGNSLHYTHQSQGHFPSSFTLTFFFLTCSVTFLTTLQQPHHLGQAECPNKLSHPEGLVPSTTSAATTTLDAERTGRAERLRCHWSSVCFTSSHTEHSHVAWVSLRGQHVSGMFLENIFWLGSTMEESSPGAPRPPHSASAISTFSSCKLLI